MVIDVAVHGVHLGVVGVGFAFGRAVVAVDLFLEVNDLPRAISRIGGAIIEFDLLPRAVGRGGTVIVEINCRGKRLEFADCEFKPLTSIIYFDDYCSTTTDSSREEVKFDYRPTYAAYSPWECIDLVDEIDDDNG